MSRRCWLFGQAMLVMMTLACHRPPTAPLPQQAASPDPAAKYIIGAHYYSWFPEVFGKGFLRRKLLPPQQPELGHYSSWEVEVAERQIDWASEYGIDFFTLDYWPTKDPMDTRHETFLSARNIEDIQFCIFYETIALGFDEKTDAVNFDSKTTAKFVSDMETIAHKYFAHPQYLRVQGRPVVVLYVTRTFTGDYKAALQEARRSLKAEGHDVFLVGDEVYWSAKPESQIDGQPGSSPEPKPGRIRLFDAITAYNFYNKDISSHQGYGSESTFLKDIADLSQEYKDATAGQVPLLPSVIPGYNDRGVRPEKDHFAIPRQWKEGDAEGTFLSEMFDQYALPFVDQSLPIVFVTSWNEFSEDTSVEPVWPAPATSADVSGSQAFTQGYSYGGYGATYLDVIRDKVVAVSGVVTAGEEGEPVAGKTVSAWKGGALIATDVSDSQGRFHLSRMTMSPGFYSVGLESKDAVQLRVAPGQTTSGVILTSGEAPPKKIRSGPDLEPRRKDLDAGLVKYVEAFPKADYKIVSSGQYRFYVDPVKDATKDVLRANQPWEPHVQEQLRQLIKPGDVVLDVGANIGAHTTLMADLVGKDGVVYAFEPRWNLYRELVQNLRLNGSKNVVPLRFAIGDGSGVIELKGTDSQATPSRAELRTLDSFHFQPVNLLRIDVEGYEDHVLAGAAETVKKNQPPILIEMMGGNDYTTASEEVRRRIEHTKGLLAALGYRTRKTWRHDYLAVPIGEEPDRVKLDLGLPENRAQLLSGFSWDESDSKTTFVWSEAATSTMAISLPAPSAAPYVLGLRVRAFHAIAPATAEVKLNEVNLGTINVGPEWSGLELNVPAKAVKAGVNELQFLFKKTGQPSALLSGNTDQRNLALSFDLIWLAPKELPLPGALRDPRKSPR